MPTHQSLGGASDEDLLQRMVATHPERFDAPFWAFYDTHVGRRLPPRAVMIDLGCGPGLLLRDLGERHPDAILHGYDVTPAMITYGRRLAFKPASVSLTVHDVDGRAAAARRCHRESGEHVVGAPRLRRAPADPGRDPSRSRARRDLSAERLDSPAALELSGVATRRHEGERARRGQTRLRLFPVHNKYTVEDWRWLLGEAGFEVLAQTELRASHRIFVATPTR